MVQCVYAIVANWGSQARGPDHVTRRGHDRYSETAVGLPLQLASGGEENEGVALPVGRPMNIEIRLDCNNPSAQRPRVKRHPAVSGQDDPNMRALRCPEQWSAC
jgi:hypothetical protein